MGHSLHHAQSSARKFGGVAADYQAVHDWFDTTKAHVALPGHRALRHHSEGIFEAERIFGAALTNSSGRVISVRYIGEQHVREDCRRIPTVGDWVQHLVIQPWMVNGVILPDIEQSGNINRDHWRKAVAAQQTELSFSDWAAQHEVRGQTGKVGKHCYIENNGKA